MDMDGSPCARGWLVATRMFMSLLSHGWNSSNAQNRAPRAQSRADDTRQWHCLATRRVRLPGTGAFRKEFCNRKELWQRAESSGPELSCR